MGEKPRRRDTTFNWSQGSINILLQSNTDCSSIFSNMVPSEHLKVVAPKLLRNLSKVLSLLPGLGNLYNSSKAKQRDNVVLDIDPIYNQAAIVAGAVNPISIQ